MTTIAYIAVVLAIVAIVIGLTIEEMEETKEPTPRTPQFTVACSKCGRRIPISQALVECPDCSRGRLTEDTLNQIRKGGL